MWDKPGGSCQGWAGQKAPWDKTDKMFGGPNTMGDVCSSREEVGA